MTAVTTRVVDADSHVIEPPGAWDDHVPRALRDRTPQLAHRDDGDWLAVDGTLLQPYSVLSGLARGSALVGGGERPPAMAWRDAILEGAHDPEARLGDMDTDGIDIAVIYPTMAMSLFALDDRELARVLVCGYNRWLAAFCHHCSDRLKGVGMLLPGDDTAVAADVDLCCDLGLVGLLVPDTGPPFHDPLWDPVWRAASEAGLPVAAHAFAGRSGAGARTDPLMDALVERTAAVERSLVSLVFGGVFDRFGDLRFVSVENEASWAAGLIGRADVSFRRGRRSAPPLAGCTRLPSEVFHEHVFFTIIHDQAAIDARRVIGVENLLWSTDYPHNASTWPHSLTTLDGYLRPGIDPGDVERLAGANTVALYGLA